jgi:hypothetical protein
MTETVAPAPGIDMRRLKPGTTILLGSESHVYEMKVTYPVHGIVEISSTDAPLRLATVGQFLHSSHWLGGNVLSGWIGKGLVMQIRFRNGIYTSQPIVSARVSGEGWAYDVF